MMNPVRPRPSFRADRRGATALMVGVMAPAILGIAATVVDAGFWVVGQTRLQIAADAGAIGAGYLLNSSSWKAMNSTNQTTAIRSVVQFEAQAAAPKLIGTLTTPVGVTFSSGSVTVTLTSQMSSYFLGAFGIQPPLVRATATVTLKTTGPCVAALAPTGIGIQVDNSGTVTAAGCPVWSNSTGTQSIYVNSGNITSSGANASVSAAGTVAKSNSGSNTISPAGTNNAGATSDPDASLGTPTAPATCNVTGGNYSSYDSSTKVFTPTGSPPTYTFCGNTYFQGNGSTATFNPGTYYVKDGNLTFDNQNTAAMSGVSFIMTGSTATSTGNFSWTNYSNTSTPLSPATTGPAAGKAVAIWQQCNSNGSQTMSIQGGSTLTMSGAIYAPCSSVDIGNNAQVNAALNSAFSIIAYKLYVHGSATVRSSAGTGGGTSGTAVLTQ